MFSQRSSKIICAVFLMIPLFITSCDDFKEETYKPEPLDALGVEAISVTDNALTVTPLNISWNDSLQIYNIINTGLSDTSDVASITAVWDTLMKHEIEVAPVESRIIWTFDTAGVALSVDTVLLAAVNDQVSQFEANPSVDSIHVSVPFPNYFVTIGGNTDGYSIAYASQAAGKVQIFLDNFVNIRIIEVSSMDSTYIVPADIPLELIASYFNVSDNDSPDPILKSYVSIDLENKDYIIQLFKTETTINSGRTYFSLVTE